MPIEKGLYAAPMGISEINNEGMPELEIEI
jgi:hypothetical protein